MSQTTKTTNKYGLSRNIPADIQRKVRKRCGFGCVVCGNFIFQYEHFQPEFNQAKFHDPDGITLLCGSCHDRKTRKFLSPETVIKHNTTPKALSVGFSHDTLDIGQDKHPTIVIGSNTFIDTWNIITVNRDEVIMKIAPPEEENGPFLFSFKVRDRSGRNILEIEDNFCKVKPLNWDVTSIGGKIAIRSGNGAIDFEMKIIPPNKVEITRLNMLYGSTSLIILDDDSLAIANSETREKPSTLRKVTFKNNDSAIHIDYEPITKIERNESIIKMGRNELCYCGSEKKYKRCHGTN